MFLEKLDSRSETIIDVSGKWAGRFLWSLTKDPMKIEIMIQQSEADLKAFMTLCSETAPPSSPSGTAFTGEIDGTSVRFQGASKFEKWLIEGVVRDDRMDGKLFLDLTMPSSGEVKKEVIDLTLRREK
jgi:hypothetical protein